jgi:hypothetical protein
LVRWEISYSDNRPVTLPYGDAATGLLQYTGDGWMSACIARGGRDNLSSNSVRQAPQSEQLMAFESYFQYAGRYEVRTLTETQQQVAHTVSHSLNPNFVGTQQVRNVDFDTAGDLTLSASDTMLGTVITRHHRLMWARRSPA